MQCAGSFGSTIKIMSLSRTISFPAPVAALRAHRSLRFKMLSTPQRFQYKSPAVLAAVAADQTQPLQASLSLGERRASSQNRVSIQAEQGQVVIWSVEDDKRIMADADIRLGFSTGSWMPVHSWMLGIHSPILHEMCNAVRGSTSSAHQNQRPQAVFDAPISSQDVQQVLQLVPALNSTRGASSSVVSPDLTAALTNPNLNCRLCLYMEEDQETSGEAGGLIAWPEAALLLHDDAPAAWRAFLQVVYGVKPFVGLDPETIQAAYSIAYKYKAESILERMTASVVGFKFKTKREDVKDPEFILNWFILAKKYANTSIDTAVMEKESDIEDLFLYTKWPKDVPISPWIDRVAAEPAAAAALLQLLHNRSGYESD